MDFAPFDRRRYPTLAVREGYREWAETYEDVVQDEMDLRLVARIETVDWAAANRVLELAWGTGRIGAWLRAHGVRHLDGLDFTPEMLARAAAKGVYDRLFQADMLDSGLSAAGYDPWCGASGHRRPEEWHHRRREAEPVDQTRPADRGGGARRAASALR